MKDRALEIARSTDTELRARNRLREYLQHVILRELFDLDLLEDLVFHGGTALRILHGLERFSEDLDFHTRTPDTDLELEPALESLRSQLEYQGYRVDPPDPSGDPVKNCFLNFVGLLPEAGLTDHEDEKLRVKLEIDTRPPAGSTAETRAVNVFFPYVVHHHDRPSFLAGKLHALLQREWTKGRDFYDLWFFVTRWEGIEPNLPYLRSALDQTGYGGPDLTETNWRSVVAQRVEKADWDAVLSDVEPFLLRQSDLKAFRRDLLLTELGSG